jgi:hypothetical protein
MCRSALRIHLQSMFYFFALPMTIRLEIARFIKIRRSSPQQRWFSCRARCFSIVCSERFRPPHRSPLPALCQSEVTIEVPGWAGAAGIVIATIVSLAILMRPRVRPAFAVAGGMLLVAVPVSFAGLGLAEAGASGLFLTMGYSPAVALAAGAITYFARLVGALEEAVWEVLESGAATIATMRRLVAERQAP